MFDYKCLFKRGGLCSIYFHFRSAYFNTMMQLVHPFLWTMGIKKEMTASHFQFPFNLCRRIFLVYWNMIFWAACLVRTANVVNLYCYINMLSNSQPWPNLKDFTFACYKKKNTNPYPNSFEWESHAHNAWVLLWDKHNCILANQNRSEYLKLLWRDCMYQKDNKFIKMPVPYHPPISNGQNP